MKRSHSYNSEMNFTNSVNPIHLCIVGAGRAAEFHIQSLLINRQYKLEYIVDLQEEKAINLSKKINCKYSNNLDWVFQNVHIDAVIICTTTPTHYNLTMKCLNAGKHVFCEKPLGKNEEEISNCFKLANSTNLKLLIAYQKRFDNNYNQLYELLKEQKNRPTHIHMKTRDHPLPPLEYLKTSNGIVEDMISHDIDIANLYMNFQVPSKVIAFTYTHNKSLQEINEIEGIEILLHYPNGEIVNLSGSRNAIHGYDQRVEVFGDFGMIQLENQVDDTLTIFHSDGSSRNKMNYSFAQRYKQAYLNELDYFYKMINQNYAPLVEEQHLILTKKICNAINESIEQSKIIYLQNQLRIYEQNTPQYFLYRDMHINQTLDYVKLKYTQYSSLQNCKMSIKEALLSLDSFIDPSDPDLDVQNSIHAYQTAERIRKKYPENKELQVIGLIHDLGKVMFTFGEPNWSIVGDTFVLGCTFPKSIVYYDTLRENPDFEKYDKLGIYKEGCGLDKLYISFGHDEYLYQVLLQNKDCHKISEQSMNIIRYHSFYPWHTSGEYRFFMNDQDSKTLEDVNHFNQFDLYSKEDDSYISSEIKKYYDNVLDEFFISEMQF